MDILDSSFKTYLVFRLSSLYTNPKIKNYNEI